MATHRHMCNLWRTSLQPSSSRGEMRGPVLAGQPPCSPHLQGKVWRGRCPQTHTSNARSTSTAYQSAGHLPRNEVRCECLGLLEGRYAPESANDIRYHKFDTRRVPISGKTGPHAWTARYRPEIWWPHLRPLVSVRVNSESGVQRTDPPLAHGARNCT